MTSHSVFAAGPVAALTGLGHLTRRKAREAEQSHPPLGGLVDIDGTRAHFTREGQGPAVILIHGAGGNVRDFTFELTAKISRTNEVITFDRPGHGYTDPMHPNGETLAEQAHLLHQAALKLGITKAIVCGYSFGGSVALEWALQEPEFVQGLMLISAVTHPWPGGIGLLFGASAHVLTAPFIVPAIAAFTPESLVSKTLASVFSPQEPPKGYLDYIGAGLSLRAHSIKANARQVAKLKSQVTEMAARYPSLSMPVEILHGTKDRTIYAKLHAEKLNQDVVHSNLTTLPCIGHSPHHHAHVEILEALDRLNALRG